MAHGNNFNALKIYIGNHHRQLLRQRPFPVPFPMHVTTLAITDATLLNDIDWAVVDVETTGLSFKWCRVIDVAAVVLEKGSLGGVVDGSNGARSIEAPLHTALQTLVNPLELTGITREVPTLRHLLIVFHLQHV
jgi:hypothetical protein